ncbi:MAG: hypothetical protein AAF478_05490 [Pseudomonadota bacterium]
MTNSISVIIFSICSVVFSLFNIGIGVYPEFFWIELTSSRSLSMINSAFVVFYTAIIWNINKNSERIEKEKWADSIYYLGFILTLVALITALSIVKTGDASDLVKSTIVQNAIALSSTVWAIFLRNIWKLSLPEEQDEQTYLKELEARYKNLGDAVAETSALFTTEGPKLKKYSDEFRSTFDNLKNTINTNLEELSGSFKSYRSEIDANSRKHQKANKALETTAGHLDTFVDRIGEFSNQMTTVATTINSIEGLISSIKSTDEKLLQVLNELKDNSIEAKSDTSKIVQVNIENQTQSAQFADTAFHRIQEVQTILKGLEVSLKAVTNDLNVISEDQSLKSDTSQIRALLARFEKRSERFVKNFSRVDGPTGVKEYLINLFRAVWGR